jgi:hypothetical protein
MPTNYIDTYVTQAQIDQVMAALKLIDEALPGLVELTPEQRQGMIRYSDKDLGFIVRAQSVAEQHPEILPQGFDLEAMRKDVDALQKLDLLVRALELRLGRMQDGRYAAGSEGKGHANSVYQFVKTHHALTGQLEDILADLAKQYARSSAKPSKPPEA